MGTKLFGLFVLAVGFAAILASFDGDVLGLGSYDEVGKEQLVLTVIGILVAGLGILIFMIPSDRR